MPPESLTTADNAADGVQLGLEPEALRRQTLDLTLVSIDPLLRPQRPRLFQHSIVSGCRGPPIRRAARRPPARAAARRSDPQGSADAPCESARQGGGGRNDRRREALRRSPRATLSASSLRCPASGLSPASSSLAWASSRRRCASDSSSAAAVAAASTPDRVSIRPRRAPTTEALSTSRAGSASALRSSRLRSPAIFRSASRRLQAAFGKVFRSRHMAGAEIGQASRSCRPGSLQLHR